MQKIIIFGLFGLLFITGISCNLLTAEERELDYPSTYPTLDFSELQQMNEAYHQANDNQICSTLNEYGFTGFSEIFFENGENPCDRANREVVRIEMNKPDTLLKEAKEVLLRNSEYTGVSDTSALRLKEMSPQPGCINCGRPDEYSANIEWKLTFKNQRIDTLELTDTEIVVFIDAEGVNRIWGNWYPDITIPDFVNYGYIEVQEGMAGWEIDMRPYTGAAEIYTVQPGDISERPKKLLYQLKSEGQQQLEIRYSWALKIDHSESNFEGWWAYVDIEEGILIDLVSRQTD